MKKATVLIIIFGLLFWCCGRKNDHFSLKKYKINYQEVTTKQISIDTLETDGINDLYVLNIRDHGFLGHFSLNLIFVKKNQSSGDIVYKAENPRGIEWIVSNDYIASIKSPNQDNYGFFFMKDGKLMEDYQM